MPSKGDTASQLIEALGAAWSIHGLYPDPEEQEAFVRAVNDVPTGDTEPFTVAVGPGAFIVDGEEFRTERQAAERLAVRLFVHSVELLRFAEPPSTRDVVRFFNILAKEPEAVTDAGGVGAGLARDGVTAFQVVERSELGDYGGGEDIERDDEVSEVMAEGVDPATFAADLMAEAGDNPDHAAKAIHDRYHDVLGRVSTDDVAGREEVVQAFVEAYFHLPEEVQVPVVEAFLSNHENTADRAFLDQFAGHELARMSTRLDGQAMALLMDYANVVTDPEADARSGELLALIEEAPSAVDSARQAIASHMSDRFGSMVDGPGDGEPTYRFEVPDSTGYFFTVLEVFRDLLCVEDRDERFGRLMRIWSGKVLGSLRNGEFRRAELWMRAVRDNPTFPHSREAAVNAALDSLVGPEMIEQLARYYVGLEDRTPVLRLMALSGHRLADPLVDELAAAEVASVRRVLTEMLGIVAAGEPTRITSRLSDPRWYLVRNMAVALRRSGRPEAFQPLCGLLEHDDYRVRVEAVRGVALLGGDEAIQGIVDALDDEEDAVRTAAIASLGTRESEQAERALIDALDSPQLTPEQRKRAVQLIGRDPTPEARDLLNQLAGRRFALTGAARVVRDAARETLESMGEGS